MSHGFSHIMLLVGFNPCFIGNPSATKHISNGLRKCMEVSILVLLEILLQLS